MAVLKLSAPTSLAGAFLALVLVYATYLLALAFSRVFLSSKKHIPGPLLCRVSGIGDFVNNIAGRRSKWIDSLHERYGPVVMISPNLVSVSDAAAVKTIYSGKFLKAYERYKGKEIDGHRHMLTFVHRDEAKARRSMLLPLFQTSNLEDFEPYMHKYTRIMLDQIGREQAAVGNADLYKWLRLAAFDIICLLAYGFDMKMTENGEAGEIVHAMADFFAYAGMKETIPFIEIVAKSGLIKGLDRYDQAANRFLTYGRKAYADFRQGGSPDGSIKNNLLNSLHQASLKDPSIDENAISMEAGAIMVAGSDTTSTAMTYACWELAKDQQLQDRLRADLMTLSSEHAGDLPSGKEIESLTYFNGFLREVLRKWPTLPGPLERIVPDEGTDMCGVWLPGGCEVTSLAYRIHRDPNIFPKPHELLPERWDAPSDEMKLAFLTFSYGPRNCVGQNLAWLEIRVVMAAILLRYRLTLSEHCTETSMEPVEHFFNSPYGKTSKLICTGLR